MIRTFSFHAGVGLSVIAIYAAIARIWRPVLANLPLLAFTLGPSLWMCVRPVARQAIKGDAITVMSANLLVSVTDPSGMLDEIKRTDPDIILFQEYSETKHEQYEPALKERYPYITNAMRSDAFGMAVYSKRKPIERPRPYPAFAVPANARIGGVVGLRDPQIRLVIELNGREVVIQNLHTPPPVGLGMVAEQRMLIRWLADWCGTETRPIILAGDFNSTPEAQGSAWLRAAGFVDAHAQAGRGRGSTWPAIGALRHLPGVRIDQLYMAHGLACERIEVGNETGSDHRPIIARIGFSQ